MEIEKLHFKASSGKVIDTIMMSVDLPLLDHFCVATVFAECEKRSRAKLSSETWTRVNARTVDLFHFQEFKSDDQFWLENMISIRHIIFNNLFNVNILFKNTTDLQGNTPWEIFKSI